MITAFLSTLQTLAICPLLGGEAVYKACALLTIVEHTDYNDKELCDAVNMVWQITARKSPEGFVVTPNPATSIATVWFEKDMQEAKLSIIDSKGVLLSTQQVTKGARNFNLDIEHLSAGVYTIRLEQADGSIKVERVVGHQRVTILNNQALLVGIFSVKQRFIYERKHEMVILINSLILQSVCVVAD